MVGTSAMRAPVFLHPLRVARKSAAVLATGIVVPDVVMADINARHCACAIVLCSPSLFR